METRKRFFELKFWLTISSAVYLYLYLSGNSPVPQHVSVFSAPPPLFSGDSGTGKRVFTHSQKPPIFSYHSASTCSWVQAVTDSKPASNSRSVVTLPAPPPKLHGLILLNFNTLPFFSLCTTPWPRLPPHPTAVPFLLHCQRNQR